MNGHASHDACIVQARLVRKIKAGGCWHHTLHGSSQAVAAPQSGLFLLFKVQVLTYTLPVASAAVATKISPGI